MNDKPEMTNETMLAYRSLLNAQIVKSRERAWELVREQMTYVTFECRQVEEIARWEFSANIWGWMQEKPDCDFEWLRTKARSFAYDQREGSPDEIRHAADGVRAKVMRQILNEMYNHFQAAHRASVDAMRSNQKRVEEQVYAAVLTDPEDVLRQIDALVAARDAAQGTP